MPPSLQYRLDALDAALDALVDELSGHSIEALQQPPAPGQWSALQVMQHLMRSEELSMQYLRKKLSYQPELQKAGMAAALRSRLLRFYLRLPFKFKAPAPVDASTFKTDVSLDELARRWRANRRELRAFLDGLPADLYDKEVYKHPFAGRLTLMGMVDFFDGHFRRHREQIRRGLEG